MPIRLGRHIIRQNIPLHYLKRVAIPTSGTHLFKAPPARDEGEQGPGCAACHKRWPIGTSFCLGATCSVALTREAMFDGSIAWPKEVREGRVWERSGQSLRKRSRQPHSQYPEDAARLKLYPDYLRPYICEPIYLSGKRVAKKESPCVRVLIAPR